MQRYEWTTVFQPFCRHHIQTTVFFLSSYGSSVRSSLYSWQAGVSGFWCHRLERSASPLRGFQTTTHDLSIFPFYQDTNIRLLCYYRHSSLSSGRLWSLQYLTLFRPRQNVNDDDDDDDDKWWWWLSTLRAKCTRMSWSRKLNARNVGVEGNLVSV